MITEIGRLDDDRSEDEGWADNDDEIEGELLESMEELALLDEYRAKGQDDMLYLGQELPSAADGEERTSGSPKKRLREF